MSPEWILNKAKNHTGYGFDGRVNPGEVQVTAISGDTPEWFLGPRTFEGPFHCKSVPVRRCPDVNFTVLGKSFSFFGPVQLFGRGLQKTQFLQPYQEL